MLKILIPFLLVFNISCEDELKLPRNRYDNYKKPSVAQLRSIKQNKKQYKNFMKYLSAGNISSLKEINSLIKYYKSQAAIDKVNKLRYKSFVASLIAMKSREIKDPKKRAKYAKKSVKSFKNLEPKVRKTKNLRSLKDYYETKARTYFQLPWPYAKSPEKLKTFRTASFYITKYLQKHKWLPSEELGIFYLELALTEYDEGNELKAKVAAKKARKFKLSLVQDQLAKKLEKGSI